MAGALPHVVHVVSSVDPRAGAGTVQLVALIRAQIGLGMAVSVVSTYAPDFDASAARSMQEAGAHLKLIGPSTAVQAWHPKLSRGLREVIATANVVHVHGLWDEIQHRAAVIAREVGVPYLLSLPARSAGNDPQSTVQNYMAVRLKQNLQGAAAIHYGQAPQAVHPETAALAWATHYDQIIRGERDSYPTYTLPTARKIGH